MNIRSLDELRQRKYEVRRITREFEEDIVDDFYSLTHPFSNIQSSFRIFKDLSPSYNRGIVKLIVNGRRLIEMVKLGTSIIRDFKK